jgi:hypothetical protein
MGMHEGRARLNKSMKELMMRWNETKSQWNDSNARGFESRFLAPLEQDAKAAVGAMDHMAQVIQRIRGDCE